MIVDFHVMLCLATRGSPFRLIKWREGTELFDSQSGSQSSNSSSASDSPERLFQGSQSRLAFSSHRMAPPGAMAVHRHRIFINASKSTTCQSIPAAPRNRMLRSPQTMEARTLIRSLGQPAAPHGSRIAKGNPCQKPHRRPASTPTGSMPPNPPAPKQTGAKPAPPKTA